MYNKIKIIYSMIQNIYSYEEVYKNIYVSQLNTSHAQLLIERASIH